MCHLIVAVIGLVISLLILRKSFRIPLNEANFRIV